MLRAATELDPETTLVSLDGRSAYDSVSRAAIMGKLKGVAPLILPFVRSLYARVSTYLWWDDSSRCHEIAQAEGVEQGDSLASALFALGQHDALAAAARELEAVEFLAAFLDDILLRRHLARPIGCWSLPPSSARPGLLQTLAKRACIMAMRREAYTSSVRTCGAATSPSHNAGSLLWARPSATRN